MKPHLILGVDPGLSGALALYDPRTKKCVDVFDMPTVIGKNGRPEIELFQLASLIDPLTPQIEYAVVEFVGAMPNQGLSSTFKFGFVTGVVTGVIAAHYIPVTTIAPSVWKPGLGLDRHKARSVEKARDMFPESSKHFTLKKHDGRAEALLLAVFASKFRKTN